MSTTLTSEQDERIFVLWDSDRGCRVAPHIGADRPQGLQRLAQEWTGKFRRRITVKSLAEISRLMRQLDLAQEPRLTETKDETS